MAGPTPPVTTTSKPPVVEPEEPAPLALHPGGPSVGQPQDRATLVDFGTVAVAIGTEVTRDVTVTNTTVSRTKKKPLTVTVEAVQVWPGTPFAVVDDGCTGLLLAPGDTCTFAIRFAPTATAQVKSAVSLRLSHVCESMTYEPCELLPDIITGVPNFSQTFADPAETIVSGAEWSGDLADDSGVIMFLGAGSA